MQSECGKLFHVANLATTWQKICDMYELQCVRSLYITEFQAIVSIGIAYVVAPPTWDDLTHLTLNGLVDSSNQLWREGTDLASVAREV